MHSEGSRVFILGIKEGTSSLNASDRSENSNKKPAKGTILTEGINSEMLEGDATNNFENLHKRMKKIKQMKKKVKSKNERKVNSMLMNENEREFILSGTDLRRHTEKLGFIKGETK